MPCRTPQAETGSTCGFRLSHKTCWNYLQAPHITMPREFSTDGTRIVQDVDRGPDRTFPKDAVSGRSVYHFQGTASGDPLVLTLDICPACEGIEPNTQSFVNFLSQLWQMEQSVNFQGNGLAHPIRLSTVRHLEKTVVSS